MGQREYLQRAMSRPSTLARHSARSFAVWAMCLGCSLGMGSCRPLFQREVAGKILALAGEATGQREGHKTALTSKGFIHSGETISAHENSRIDLLLVPGILVELVGDTEIEIISLRLARDGDETIRPMTVRTATIRLRRGTLITSLGEAQTDPQLRVETPHGTLTANADRTFRVDVTPGKTRILSVRRQLAFHIAGSATDLKIPAGDFVTLPAATSNLRSAAEAGAEAQAQVRTTLEVEKRLLLLEDQSRDDFKPW